jgi:small subunit ribosomal protein S4e
MVEGWKAQMNAPVYTSHVRPLTSLVAVMAVAQYKLCRVRKQAVGAKGVPYLVTHDGRTIRYPNPDVKANDTVKVDIESGKITEHLKFETGQLVMITGGHNIGRVGVLINREKHPGSYEISHIKDAASKTFSTRTENVFVIGEGNRSYISLPKGKGIKLSIMEEAAQRKE